jgi:hypothetical protein
MLSTVRAKYTKLDKKYRQKNVELTEEYKRMTEQYKDLQTKLSHFQEYPNFQLKFKIKMHKCNTNGSCFTPVFASNFFFFFLALLAKHTNELINETFVHLIWVPPTHQPCYCSSQFLHSLDLFLVLFFIFYFYIFLYIFF